MSGESATADNGGADDGGNGILLSEAGLPGCPPEAKRRVVPFTVYPYDDPEVSVVCFKEIMLVSAQDGTR